MIAQEHASGGAPERSEPSTAPAPETASVSPNPSGHDAEVHLEPMRRRHLAAVLAIEAHAMHRPWSFGTFMRELSLVGERTYLVARRDGVIVGFGGIMYVADEGHITNIAVLHEAKRSGIGTRLMLGLLFAAIDHGMVSSSLEVRAGNEAAIAMYRRFGYAPAGIRPNYYAEAGEDALVMWAHDIDSADYRRRLTRVAAGAGLHGAPGAAPVSGQTSNPSEPQSSGETHD